MKFVIVPMLAAALAAGCAATRTPQNSQDASAGEAYQAQYRSAEADLRVQEDPAADREDLARRSVAHVDAEGLVATRSAAMNARRCTSETAARRSGVELEPELLSAGDLLEVTVAQDDVFSGAYEVSRDGRLKLPHIRPTPAQGRTVEDVESAVAEALRAGGYYRARPRVSIRISDFASARLHVAGSVFEPGAVTIGGVAGDDRDLARQSASGASGEGRTLSAALRAAGGIRPDADLSRVSVVRSGRTRIVDARPALEGRAWSDVMLLAGDEVIVPSRGCFQEALMKPASINPPGVKTYLSNLTRPADANALSAVGKDVREMPYGVRFSQAAFGMNCMGGAKWTNADRRAVLFSRNPMTGESVVIERRLEDLLRRADRDELDPYLLPGDSIACYDSTVTDVTEAAKALAITLSPAILLGL